MMSKVKKSQQKTAHQTKKDFLRWLKERNALTKKAAEDQNNQADRFIEQALMVWVDDGGMPDYTHLETACSN